MALSKENATEAEDTGSPRSVSVGELTRPHSEGVGHNGKVGDDRELGVPTQFQL